MAENSPIATSAHDDADARLSACRDASPEEASCSDAPLSAQFFPVAERFVSINGEGLAAGRLCAFIRFAGCNLWCSYCDTRWANHPLVAVEGCSIADLLQWVKETEISAVMLTGGEPLCQPHLVNLVRVLMSVDAPHPLRVEIETNGSCDISPLIALRHEADEQAYPGSLHLTLDWKTPSAGEAVCDAMLEGNYGLLDERDAVKFVVGTQADLLFARDCIASLGEDARATMLLSPIWGQIDPVEIVEFMKEHTLYRARLQLQMHKIIWDSAERGV